jgi:hypothetical protein
LTADFVLVFDFDYLCGPKTNRSKQLTTIVLSRARKQTHVAPLGDSGGYVNVLRQIIEFEAQHQVQAR